MKKYTIYILENQVNGKRYVGQTIRHLKHRIKEHLIGCDSIISHAIRKHGIDNFTITSFEVSSLDELNDTEIVLIQRLDSLVSGNGYNVSYGGKNSPLSADQKAHLKDSWSIDKRRKQSNKLKMAWLKKVCHCPVCGKDGDMGYNPDIDFGLCQSCRQAKHMSDDLGIDFHQKTKKSLSADLY